MARRYSIITLTNNADAAALETARAALTAADGHPVIGGAKVSLHARSSGEAIISGDLVGFARVPATVNADRSIATFIWARWAGGDMSLADVSPDPGTVSAPVEVPIGATAIISLPLAAVDTNGGTSVLLGIYSQAQDTMR